MPIRLTPATKTLLILNVACFVLRVFDKKLTGDVLVNLFALTPAQFVHGQVWQVVTYAFFHSDPFHLMFNMMMLAFLGWEIESALGTMRFLRLYFACAVVSGLVYLVFQIFSASLFVPLVGASAAIFGILMAYAILFGERTMLFMMLVPMKAKHFVAVIAAFELLVLFWDDSTRGLSSLAHLSGLATGFGLLWTEARWKARARKDGKTKQSARDRSHLKLVSSSDFDESKKPSDPNRRGPKTWH